MIVLVLEKKSTLRAERISKRIFPSENRKLKVFAIALLSTTMKSTLKVPSNNEEYQLFRLLSEFDPYSIYY